ncbi:hypothetical protein CBL_10106 [Carabus blaptoides fortunei]
MERQQSLQYYKGVAKNDNLDLTVAKALLIVDHYGGAQTHESYRIDRKVLTKDSYDEIRSHLRTGVNIAQVESDSSDEFMVPLPKYAFEKCTKCSEELLWQFEMSFTCSEVETGEAECEETPPPVPLADLVELIWIPNLKAPTTLLMELMKHLIGNAVVTKKLTSKSLWTNVSETLLNLHKYLKTKKLHAITFSYEQWKRTLEEADLSTTFSQYQTDSKEKDFVSYVRETGFHGGLFVIAYHNDHLHDCDFSTQQCRCARVNNFYRFKKKNRRNVRRGSVTYAYLWNLANYFLLGQRAYMYIEVGGYDWLQCYTIDDISLWYNCCERDEGLVEAYEEEINISPNTIARGMPVLWKCVFWSLKVCRYFHRWRRWLRNRPNVGIEIVRVVTIGNVYTIIYKVSIQKVLNSQSQQYLLNVVKYFKKEKENESLLLPVQAAIERAAQAFLVGISTVNRVTRRVYEAHTSGTRLMQYAEKYTICMPKVRQHITIATLHESLKKKDVISFGSTTLYKVLCDIGFKYRTDDNRRSLCEKNYIVEQRISFLRKYRMNKATDQLAVIFLDETWIFGRGSQRRSWQDESVLSVKKQSRWSREKDEMGLGTRKLLQCGRKHWAKWQNYIKHAEALIEESWQRECGRDLPETASVIIHLGSDTDTDCEY